VCGESRKHGSEGGQGFLRVRLPYPTAAYLCGVCGIANATLDNSAAYLQSWMQVLHDNPTMLVHAAAQAQRAADYIQNLPPDTGA